MKKAWTRMLVWLGYRCPCHGMKLQFRWGWDWRTDGWVCPVTGLRIG